MFLKALKKHNSDFLNFFYLAETSEIFIQILLERIEDFTGYKNFSIRDKNLRYYFIHLESQILANYCKTGKTFGEHFREFKSL